MTYVSLHVSQMVMITHLTWNIFIWALYSNRVRTLLNVICQQPDAQEMIIEQVNFFNVHVFVFQYTLNIRRRDESVAFFASFFTSSQYFMLSFSGVMPFVF